MHAETLIICHSVRTRIGELGILRNKYPSWWKIFTEYPCFTAFHSNIHWIFTEYPCFTVFHSKWETRGSSVLHTLPLLVIPSFHILIHLWSRIAFKTFSWFVWIESWSTAKNLSINLIIIRSALIPFPSKLHNYQTPNTAFSNGLVSF